MSSSSYLSSYYRALDDSTITQLRYVKLIFRRILTTRWLQAGQMSATTMTSAKILRCCNQWLIQALKKCWTVATSNRGDARLYTALHLLRKLGGRRSGTKSMGMSFLVSQVQTSMQIIQPWMAGRRCICHAEWKFFAVKFLLTHGAPDYRDWYGKYEATAMTNPLTKWLKCNHCAISTANPPLGATPRDIAVYAGHPNIALLIDEFEKRKRVHKL